MCHEGEVIRQFVQMRKLGRITLYGKFVTQKVNKRGMVPCEPLGRLHGMPVGQGLSKVRTPLSHLLSLVTVTCRTGAHIQLLLFFP